MIRALLTVARRAELRRAVGFVTLVAFVLVVALSATHAGEGTGDHHEHCGVCSAVSLIGASETFVPPQLVGVLDVAPTVEPAAIRVPRAVERRREPSPRPPPSPA